jgi:hypothetical protein
MSICDSCIRRKGCKWNKGNPRYCTLYTDKNETNFSRITKSPETLSELMQNCVNCDDCPITNKSVCKYKYENCKETWVEWLKQESE